MHNSLEASLPAIVPPVHGREETRRKPKAPTVWEQLFGVFTEPAALFRRLGDTPRWGQALWIMIAAGALMMTLWGRAVDVDALQRPILEQNAQLSTAQIDQAIAISGRFIIPMSLVSVTIRNLMAVLALGLVLWLFAAATDRATKPSFLHAVSAATVPNLILVPYTLMIAAVCTLKPVGGQIPERLAPSGLAYYIRPENPKLYGFLAQFDPFVIAYYALLFLALRHTMRMKRGEAALGTAIAVLLTTAWKVYFWV